MSKASAKPSDNGLSFEKALHCFPSSSSPSPEEWAVHEASESAVGELFIFFQALPKDTPCQPPHLVVEALALIFRRDIFSAGCFVIDDEDYEMSFMEELLSARASEAARSAKVFPLLKLKTRQVLGAEQINMLNSIEKTFGNCGQPGQELHGDPLFYFLKQVGVELDPSRQREPITMDEVLHMIANESVLQKIYMQIPEPEELEIEAVTVTDDDPWNVLKSASTSSSKKDVSSSTEQPKNIPLSPKTAKKDLFALAAELADEKVTESNSKSETKDLFALAEEIGQMRRSTGSSVPEPQAPPVQSPKVEKSPLAASKKRSTKSVSPDLPSASAVDSKSTDDTTASDNSISAAVESESKRKTLSMQATLDKLEEQKQKSHERLEQFVKEHETLCAQGLAGLSQRSIQFEEELADRLKEQRKSIVDKLKLASLESREKLSGLGATGRTEINRKANPALAELEAVKDEKKIKEAFGLLQNDADSFANKIGEDIQTLSRRNRDDELAALVQTELSKLEAWRVSNSDQHKNVFDEVMRQLIARRDAVLLELASSVKSMREVMRDMKESDIERFKLLKSQGEESLGFSFKHAEMRLTRLLDKTLSEQILPLLSDLKSALGQRSHEMKSEFADRLDLNSQESLKEFDVLLQLGKNSLKDLNGQILELRTDVENEGKELLNSSLAELNSSLESSLASFKETQASLANERSNSNAGEEQLLKQADIIYSRYESDLRVVLSQQDPELNLQLDDLLGSWTAETRSKAAAVSNEFKHELSTFKMRRQSARDSLVERLNKLAEKAESIPAEFIQ